MDKLIIYYEFLEKRYDNKTYGYVSKITYGDKVLATFNTDTQYIDLSVLNPFSGKEVIVKYNNGKEEHKIITNLELTESNGRKGYLVNLENIEKEVE